MRKIMVDSYECYLLGQGLPIPISPCEMTPDIRVTRATKNDDPYPVNQALAEVRLRSSSKGYRALLRRDYAGRGVEDFCTDTTYVLYTDNMRTITIVHRSPHNVGVGKRLIKGALHPQPQRFHGSGINYEMLDQLQAGAEC